MSKKTPPIEPSTLEQLLDRFSIPRDGWDVLLVGDGSGDRWGRPIGFACVMVERLAMTRRVFYGALNDGTVNVAELMAYLAPLSWYAEQIAKARKQIRVSGARSVASRNVHIITDSQYVQTRPAKGNLLDTPQHTVLLTAFEMFNRLGMQLHWHWAERQTVALNVYADGLSKQARGDILADPRAPEHLWDEYGLQPEAMNPKE